MRSVNKEFLKDLKWRGLVYDATPGLDKDLGKGVTVYIGIDPTGDSLHIGHLMGVTMAKRFVDAGHKAIIIMGGGTSLIGDPSGKDAERPMVDYKVIEANKRKLKKQLSRFLDFDGKRVQMIDNVDWLGKVKLIEFLREVGKYMPVSSMMDKESVKARLEREQGLSYAEFSYQLLQAYDFAVLFEKHGCNVQMGGSDQWGNILQGVDLIRRKYEKTAHGLSFPLIVDPKTGRKFGKTESGSAIWLDPEKTHPFGLYQFLINVSDELAPTLLKFYSFKDIKVIKKVLSDWDKDRQGRLVQRVLAEELVTTVHGEKKAKQSRKVAQVLFDRGKERMSRSDFEFVKLAIPHMEIKNKSEIVIEKVLVELGLVSSKSEARRVVEQNGVSYELFYDKYFLIRKGKKDFGVVEVV